jgi:phosphoserine phosphatase
MTRKLGSILAVILLAGAAIAGTVSAESLASWNDGKAKQSIVSFVADVQAAGIPEAERIAVFDNDGTLWAEQPLYFQLIYAIDKVKALAPQHPEWKEAEPFKSVLAGDVEKALAGGNEAILELVMATHAGMTTEEFEASVRDWLATAKHPKTGRLYVDMLYRPMLELLDYLRDNGFTVFIVSGGGIEFLRVFAEDAYGIPPEQVVGSSIVTKYEVRDGTPVIVRLPELNFLDDKAGKPVAINRHIGGRPLAAFGNSDGDFEMLEWTTAGPGPRFGMFVRHDDAEREWAYDRDSHIGKLARGLDEASDRGWSVASMKDDWKTVFGK